VKCLRCDKPAARWCRGHCEKHYRYLLATGRFAEHAMVDAGPTFEHLRRLRELHWTYDALAAAMTCFA
jgi:hypothetical protein